MLFVKIFIKACFFLVKNVYVTNIGGVIMGQIKKEKPYVSLWDATLKDIDKQDIDEKIFLSKEEIIKKLKNKDIDLNKPHPKQKELEELKKIFKNYPDDNLY